MSPAPESAVTMIEMALGLGLALRLLRQTKYEHAPRVRRLTAGDWGLAWGIALLGLLLHQVSPWLVAAACAVAWIFLALLWLDVALYGCFTFELGFGGARDVVLSNLAAEVFSMRSSRRFFVERPAFLVLPLVLPVLFALFFLDEHSLYRRGLEIFLGLYFGATLLRRRVPPPTPATPSPGRRALWIDFLFPRRPRIPRGFEPRPEHAALLVSPDSTDEHHPLFGRLRGRSIVFLTFESLGATHLGEAHTPFLSSLLNADTTILSNWHSTPAPLTNAAHVAWYFGQWSLRHLETTESQIAALRDAGYRPIYLTAAPTVHYGLVDILKRAGFTHIIDADTLRAANPVPNAVVLDSWLETIGMKQLEDCLADHEGPFFVHIHAQNAHVPYVVEDTHKFVRYDNADDRGRFLNALEETDALFDRLVNALRNLNRKRESPGNEPILIVSSDHGQSFGEHDYRSHASAVTAEQIRVPLAIYHPKLQSFSVSFSSHFDILPTVLDLVGASKHLGFGRSLSSARRPVMQFLFDGQPSRLTSNCLGLVIGADKYSLDLVRDTLVRSTWNDEEPQLLEGEERDYFEALMGFVAERRGVT